ncbi:Protein of unknown function [Williamsia sterculiae]|uniref:DUF3499 domain-containing protein n=1 Tax=Williamsia sterculiae TaxID=1344003 RepID=A0A1N7FQW1_9NOCA|nr:Protein of unknown function [Williamsia sterculiae]
MATLTFVYADSIAVIGPLATSREPHSWDLCEQHAAGITVPRGWEMIRSESGFTRTRPEDDDLVALADAVRENTRASGGDVAMARPTTRRAVDPTSGFRGERTPQSEPHRTGGGQRPRRRGHLRVLPDPD